MSHLPSGVRLSTTPAGLRVITEPMSGFRSVALGLWIGVGSRFEAAREAGVSHFLEHLLFKGTARHSAQRIAQIFDGLGGEVNAATGRDYTVLYARVLDAHLDAAFDVLADMVQRPGLFELDQEREVVLEEIAMYEDDPGDLVHDLATAAVFPDQPLGRPVIGSADVIGSVPKEDVARYHTLHYTAPNIVLSASGAIDHDALVDAASRLLPELSTDAAPDADGSARPGPPARVVREKPTEQVHLCFAAPGIDRNDPRRHAHSVLDTILGGSMSSRLFQEIRENRGLAYSIGSYTVGYHDGGQVGVYLGTREDNLPVACRVIGDELRRLASEPVDEAELSRAKEHLKGRMVLGLESPGTRMNRIGRSTLSGSELLDIDEVIARIEAVDADSILDLARAYWKPEAMSVAAIGPKGEPIERALGEFSAPHGAESE
ncbi:MAG: insulinase family protein [Actinobacteria bacterium]|nr:insulinase family protein [Actinomycetota bacterium]